MLLQCCCKVAVVSIAYLVTRLLQGCYNLVRMAYNRVVTVISGHNENTGAVTSGPTRAVDD